MSALCILSFFLSPRFYLILSDPQILGDISNRLLTYSHNSHRHATAWHCYLSFTWFLTFWHFVAGVHVNGTCERCMSLTCMYILSLDLPSLLSFSSLYSLLSSFTLWFTLWSIHLRWRCMEITIITVITLMTNFGQPYKVTVRLDIFMQISRRIF